MTWTFLAISTMLIVLIAIFYYFSQPERVIERFLEYFAEGFEVTTKETPIEERPRNIKEIDPQKVQKAFELFSSSAKREIDAQPFPTLAGKIMAFTWLFSHPTKGFEIRPFNLSPDFPENPRQRYFELILRFEGGSYSKIVDMLKSDEGGWMIDSMKNSQIAFKVYFPTKNKKEPCGDQAINYTWRETLRTDKPWQNALSYLVAGPTFKEVKIGFESQHLSTKIGLPRADLKNGVVHIAWTAAVGTKTIGDPCTIETIKAQIRETVQQFPGVEGVQFN